MYTGPPPLPADLHPPSVPPISSLVAGIIASTDRLFFVSHSLGYPSFWEWHLICVAFLDSTALSPSCLQDGCFLVEFYTLHHEDVWFNATNQRYWLQYHSIGAITTPTSSTTSHLTWPSNMSEALATKQKLVPFCSWLNLTHSDTFLHVTFDFATVNGHNTHDCIVENDWERIAS
jgi:hypothetical protein